MAVQKLIEKEQWILCRRIAPWYSADVRSQCDHATETPQKSSVKLYTKSCRKSGCACQCDRALKLASRGPKSGSIHSTRMCVNHTHSLTFSVVVAAHIPKQWVTSHPHAVPALLECAAFVHAGPCSSSGRPQRGAHVLRGTATICAVTVALFLMAVIIIMPAKPFYSGNPFLANSLSQL